MEILGTYSDIEYICVGRSGRSAQPHRSEYDQRLKSKE